MATPKKKVTAADALIATAKAKGESPIPLPDPKTLAELKRIVEYNDTATSRSRVTVDDTIAFLRSRGWAGNCKQALVRVCVSALGRKSWGSP